MAKQRKINPDGTVTRTVEIHLRVSVDMSPDADESAILAALDENGITWSVQCELVDYGWSHG